MVDPKMKILVFAHTSLLLFFLNQVKSPLFTVYSTLCSTDCFKAALQW